MIEDLSFKVYDEKTLVSIGSEDYFGYNLLVVIAQTHVYIFDNDY